MPEHYRAHRIYRIRQNLIDSKRRIPQRTWPYAMVLGDSWMAYPGRNGDFISHQTHMFQALMRLHESPVNWFDAGYNQAETRHSERHLQDLKRFARARIQLRHLFVSSGGNDYFADASRLILPYQTGQAADALLSPSYLMAARQRVSGFYQRLVQFRDRYQPQLWLIAHGYLPPVVSNKPFSLFNIPLGGPWIGSALKEHGYDAAPDALKRELIIKLYEHLKVTIEQSFTDRNGQPLPRTSFFDGTSGSHSLNYLSPGFWADEIHLSPHGYRQYVAALVRQIQSLGLWPMRP